MEKILQPTVFNIITIVAMLIALFQLVTPSTRETTPATLEAIGVLEEIVEKDGESDPDKRLSVRLATDQLRRVGLFNNMMVAMVVAILSNVVANILGRGRHRANTARIQSLEKELSTAQREIRSS